MDNEEKITKEEIKQGEHYICLGGCRGVSLKPGVCGAPDCKDHNHALVKCDCTDGLHNNFQAKV
jgi:hypothetical protein